jgi:hypothetical protein
MSLAPAVAQSPIGPWASTTTASPMRTPADSAPLKPIEAMSAQSTTCSSVRPAGIFARFAWAAVRADIRLRAVDGVAEAPPAERLIAAPMSALRQMARQARVALPAGGDGADQHAIADGVARQPQTELLDDADGLVSDDQARPHRVFAPENVEIRAADRGERDPDHRFTGDRPRTIDLLEPDVPDAAEDRGSHLGHATVSTRRATARHGLDAMRLHIRHTPSPAFAFPRMEPRVFAFLRDAAGGSALARRWLREAGRGAHVGRIDLGLPDG